VGEYVVSGGEWVVGIVVVWVGGCVSEWLNE